MEIIKEKILLEEMQGLAMGRTIDFLDIEDRDLKIKISGEDVKNFCNADLKNFETEYLKQRIKLLTEELNSREDEEDERKKYYLTYRDEFEAVIKADSREEAIKKFQDSNNISCLGYLWEEFFKVEVWKE